jgi:hypothetical protein
MLLLSYTAVFAKAPVHAAWEAAIKAQRDEREAGRRQVRAGAAAKYWHERRAAARRDLDRAERCFSAASSRFGRAVRDGVAAEDSLAAAEAFFNPPEVILPVAAQ